MAHDFIPRRDAKFLSFSENFRNQIVANPGAFGLTAVQASEYEQLHAAFAAAYRAASNPSTRTSPTVRKKNGTRRAVEREARRLSRLIQATSSVTSAQKVSLGLTVRDTKPSPVGVPAERPRLFVKLRFGSTLRITLRGRDTARRGKPDGVAGAMIFTYVGDVPPDDLSQWSLAGTTTRPRIDITLRENIVPGAQVWVTAQWFNPRAQTGPLCEPKSTHVQCPTLWFNRSELHKAA